jgi:dolichol-phosphate mannosyltransferase
MTVPALSIVTPVYNEGSILPELVARCTHAAEQRSLSFELVIVDDASTDDTPAQVAAFSSDERVRYHRLPANVGQFRATLAGLREARGNWIAVLDGDLQDPPEQIPRLVDALTAAAPSVAAVLAVKSHRDDPAAFMMGQFVFHRLQHALSRVALPHGAGSYCLMRREVVRRVVMAGLAQANLAAVVAVAVRALGSELATISYEKGARYDGTGRVGWRRLIAEAVGSLAVTGALSRSLALLAIGLAVCGLAAGGYAVLRSALCGAAVAAAAVSLAVGLQARHALAGVRAPRGAD